MTVSIPIDPNFVGIVETDYSGIVLGVNPIFEKLSGFSFEELVGRKLGLLDASQGSQDIVSILKGHFEAGKSGWHGRLICNSKNNKNFQVEVTATPLRKQDEITSRIIWVVRDLKSFKEIENQLLQAQKMEAIGTLAGGIAHDFNNVLNIVSGFTSLALRNIKDEYSRRCLFNVLEASDRASDLVKQILSFTQRETHLFMPVSLRPLIKGILKLLRGVLSRDIEIEFLMQNGSFQILGNPTFIHQIFLNLSTNAAHAMSSGGLLKVEVDRVTLSAQQTEWDRLTQGNYIRIKVSDTGQGMAPEIAARVFEPFFTTKTGEEGTGLGLSVVSEIVKKHSGQIQVHSSLGNGTEFVLLLPELSSDAVESEQPAAYNIPEMATVLIVDDEKILVEVLSEGLMAYGFAVVAFTDSMEALNRFKSEPSTFDLILTDLMMPKLSGIELAVQAMEIRPEIPVILCTGFLEKEEETLALNLGIKKVIRKPVLIQTLVKEVSLLIWDKKIPK